MKNFIKALWPFQTVKQRLHDVAAKVIDGLADGSLEPNAPLDDAWPHEMAVTNEAKVREETA